MAVAVTQAPPQPVSAPRTPAWLVALRLAVLALAIALVWFVAASWDRWVGEATRQTTDDAYLQADITPLSARVAGYVREITVGDYARVRAGQPLARLMDDDYRAQVAQAEANLASAEANLANNRAQRQLQLANIAASAAAIDATQATLERNQSEARRQRSLLATGIAGTRQATEQADAAALSSQASLAQGQAQLEATRLQLGVLDAQAKQAEAAIAAQRAMLDLARINLGYTVITAPADGMVGQRLVRPGQLVSAGTQIISLVPLPRVWVIANYKETQLTRVRPGQPATITVDSFPGALMHGHVDSFAPASGSQFALLPADNATGNFTKVVQRLSVKLLIDDPAGLTEQLRPGMSVIPTIDTSGAP